MQKIFEDNNIDSAIKKYKNTLEKDPKNPEAKSILYKLFLLKRLRNKNIIDIRNNGAEHPYDLNSQLDVCDIDFSGGKIEDSLLRLLDFIKYKVINNSSNKDSKKSNIDNIDLAKKRLFEYFEILGMEHPSVIKAKKALSEIL